MFDEFRVRPLYIIDLVFAVAVGLLYLVFQIGLFEAGVHVRELFTGTLTVTSAKIISSFSVIP
ncbi:hypothetical protein AKJ64_00475 [candidate division MSBL1 archaeon SCGC-AAA259E17]|uniref:Uncharacterized protein n=1 Tax=candidate division MSBL1 archaeon SCGC-AAA259E17 TaxID=1698263 RepID=A0A133UH58_9EURY|nr:hypothetical protein AKJ64_00475 [candidate division MSBL1 archaeon SCGC-AAA259E17]